MWSNADASLDVEVTLSQTLFGQASATFGPYDDTGSLIFDAVDLASFGQGADIVVTVGKINQASSIQGFGVGELSVKRTERLLVSPAP